MLNMVVASTCSNIPNEKARALRNRKLPVVDMAVQSKPEMMKDILKACQEYGFFKVINHGVPDDIIRKVEQEGFAFFEKPADQKQRAGPANPLGYGCKKIGFKGDEGEIEYLLLRTDPRDISHRAKSISEDPKTFSAAMNDYIAAVRGLASKLLVMIAESLELEVTENSVFSKLVSDTESDSLIRLNHYPAAAPIPPPASDHHPHLLIPHKDCSNKDTSLPSATTAALNRNSMSSQSQKRQQWIGFGDHTDPQMLTLLRSNDVGGLQICSRDGVWVPVTPDPSAFSVNIGDVLQAMTNGKLMSVRHRVLMDCSYKSRLSVIYFASPPPNTLLTCLPELVTPEKPPLYKPFTWLDMKTVMYKLKLADNRLDHFKIQPENDEHLNQSNAECR